MTIRQSSGLSPPARTARYDADPSFDALRAQPGFLAARERMAAFRFETD